MRTSSALIIGAAALLQFDGFASAETCDSYVEYGTTTSLCSANGILDNLDPAYECTNEASCTFSECCNPATCDLFTLNGLAGGTDKCVDGTTLKGSPEGIPCDDGICTHLTCCVPVDCSTFVDGSGDLCPAGFSYDNTATCDTADNGVCTTDDCCAAATCGGTSYADCPTGSTLAGGNPCGTDGCTVEECCDFVLCSDGPYVCSSGATLVGANSCGEDTVCTEAECCVAEPTCAGDIYSCPTGTTRIDSNPCTGGTCTDLLCCSTVTESTITEARMMRTPRSRISGTQYGA